MRAIAICTLLGVLLLGGTAVAEESRTRADPGKLASAVKALGEAPGDDALDAISDDPITLRAMALHVRDTDAQLAALLFERSIAKEEINHYESFAGSTYARAVQAEAFGNLDEARKLWRSAAQVDPLTAYILAKRYSVDPEREALFGEIRAQVKGLLEAAKAGQPATIYTTAKGARHDLTFMTGAEALERIEAGQSLRYAAIDVLDLTGKQFAGTVSCSRCVVGELKGHSSTFAGFSFRGFVTGNLHVGKSWTGEVNRSRSLPAATFDELLLDKAAVFGDLVLDSVTVNKTAGLPFVVVDGLADFRNVQMRGDLDMRFFGAGKPLVLEGATLGGAAYFGHLQAGGLQLTRASASSSALLFDSAEIRGPVTAARCRFVRGMTFENARIEGAVDVHHCAISTRLNLSRARFGGPASFAYVELDDVDAFGAVAMGDFAISDSVIAGNARFALDGFTRRKHRADPAALHTLYKQYQGDVDADTLLTERSQYGVVDVDDLAVRFHGSVSFANTYFEKFVGFEGVEFGAKGTDTVASFYNAQMYGEAHFERTKFWSVADFRTISGNELSFNGAHIGRTWMLDDANVTGRLSVTQLGFEEGATLSFRGARFASFGINKKDVLSPDGESRQFYQRCADGEPTITDDRLLDARWDHDGETERPEAQARRLAKELCLDFTIAEFVVLRDSFTKRGMTQEADWAYWSLRHATNRQDRQFAPTTIGRVRGWLEWVFFENAFGWGVRLANLFWSSIIVILVYMVLYRVFCPRVTIDWDDTTMPLEELPRYALFVVSLHSFLGRTRDWKSKSSNKVWKVLYTTEVVIGILLITFFIGAYARIILR